MTLIVNYNKLYEKKSNKKKSTSGESNNKIILQTTIQKIMHVNILQKENNETKMHKNEQKYNLQKNGL